MVQVMVTTTLTAWVAPTRQWGQIRLPSQLKFPIQIHHSSWPNRKTHCQWQSLPLAVRRVQVQFKPKSCLDSSSLSVSSLTRNLGVSPSSSRGRLQNVNDCWIHKIWTNPLVLPPRLSGWAPERYIIYRSWELIISGRIRGRGPEGTIATVP